MLLQVQKDSLTYTHTLPANEISLHNWRQCGVLHVWDHRNQGKRRWCLQSSPVAMGLWDFAEDWGVGGVLQGVWKLGGVPHSFVWKMGVRSRKWGRAQKDFQRDVEWPRRTSESRFSYVILRISSILFFKYKKIYFIVSNIFQINHLKALTINNHLYSSGTFLLKSSEHFTFIISLIPKTVPVGKVISILTFKCLPFRIPQAYINSISQNVNVH